MNMSNEDMMKMFMSVGTHEKAKQPSKEELQSMAVTLYTVYSSLVDAGFSEWQAIQILTSSMMGGKA